MAGKIFSPTHVARTHEFLARRGRNVLILARVVPIVRTFVTLIGGVSRMPVRTFLGYTGVGAVLWAGGVLVLGYYLGNVTLIRDHIDLVLIGIVAVSVLPMAWELIVRRRRTSMALAADATPANRA